MKPTKICFPLTNSSTLLQGTLVLQLDLYNGPDNEAIGRGFRYILHMKMASKVIKL